MPLSLKFLASVCTNDCKLGMALSEVLADVTGDALSDVQRSWKTVAKPPGLLEVDDVLLGLAFNA